MYLLDMTDFSETSLKSVPKKIGYEIGEHLN